MSLGAVVLMSLLLIGGCGQKEKSAPKGVASHPAYTFAVVGDNRGDSAGNPAPVFVRIVEAMRKDSPKMGRIRWTRSSGWRAHRVGGRRAVHPR